MCNACPQKPGGLLLVTVPNHASMLQYLSQFLHALGGRRLDMGLRKVYLLEHTAYYTPETIAKIFRLCGMEPLEIFQSSTDLARYRLSRLEKCAAQLVLWLGQATGLQNRLVCLGKKM